MSNKETWLKMLREATTDDEKYAVLEMKRLADEAGVPELTEEEEKKGNQGNLRFVAVFLAALFAVIGLIFYAGYRTGRPRAADPASYGMPRGFAEPMSVYGWEGEKIATLYPNGQLRVQDRDYERVIRTLLLRQVMFEEQKKTVLEGVNRLRSAYDEKIRELMEGQKKAPEMEDGDAGVFGGE
jgi:hypothetical protein